MPNTINAQISERIQAFATELEALVRRTTFDSLRSALEGRVAPARRSRGPGRPRVTTEGLADKIAVHVGANPGQTVGQIAQAVGGSSAAVKKAIKAMLAAKQIRKAGERRATRYFLAGAGRLPSAAKSRGKRRGRKGRKATTRKAQRKPAMRAPRRKSRAAIRLPGRAVLIPAPRRTKRAAVAPRVVGTDVPAALA